MFANILALFLALPAFSQGQGSFQSGCFHGLNDADSPVTLDNCESPDLLNTESNLQGTALLKRRGFSTAASLTYSTWPVTGSHSFIDANGNKLDIVCQEKICFKSTNGNSFSAFFSTATAGVVRWSFVDVGGSLYGANNKYDHPLVYDGTTRTHPAGIPQGSILEMTQDRLAVGDISGFPNRVYYSSAGSYSDFTPGVNSEDPWYDDIGSAGDKIRGLKYFKGNLYIFKTQSITSCELGDQYTTRCSVIVPNLGTTDPASIVTAGDSLYFRGQDKNYWEISDAGLNQISAKIPNLVKSQSGGLAGGEITNTQTSATDWANGTQFPSSSWDSATYPGSLINPTSTFLDTLGTDFAGGTLVNLSTLSVAGSLVLSSNTVSERWLTGTTAGALGWTSDNFRIKTIGGTYFVYGLGSGVPGQDLSDSLYATGAFISSGSFKFDWRFYDGISDSGNYCSKRASIDSVSNSSCFSMRFITSAGGNYYDLAIKEDPGAGVAVKKVTLNKTVGGVTTNLAISTRTFVRNITYSFEIVKSTDGRFSVYQNDVFVSSTAVADTAVSSSTRISIFASHVSNATGEIYNQFANVSDYQYRTSGSIVSREFDTQFSTPTWGAFSADMSTTTNLPITLEVQASATSGSGYESLVSQTNNAKMGAAANRYIRYKASFSTALSTATPTLNSAQMTASTTGQFQTQCIQPNSSISSWGMLSCSQAIAGNASVVYYATSAATCAGLPTGGPLTWGNTATNNATLAISTNAAVKYGWRSLLGSATDQAEIDSCSLAWNESTPVQPSWAVYDSIKNVIYWTTTINNASSSNRLLKYDRNLKSWYPFDIAAQAPRMIANSLYFGSATAGTWNKYGDVDSDAGSSINAYWKTKDIGSSEPFLEKSFETFSLLAANQSQGVLYSTATFSNSDYRNFSTSLSTGTGINYIRSNNSIPEMSGQNFMNLKMGNNSSSFFQILGYGVTWSSLPWYQNSSQ